MEISDYLSDLGANGGQMTVSVYDTAQVMRLYPVLANQRTQEWLLDQQRSDGGWDDPIHPRARTAPTLAALLALAPTLGLQHPALQKGIGFLQQQEPLWADVATDELPVGVELLVPTLLSEAAASGFEIPVRYTGLHALAQVRRRMLRGRAAMRGSPATHSWEGWGSVPEMATLDALGSIASSPSATAAWMRAVAGQPAFADQYQLAQRYLESAHAATGSDIPGAMPTAWPIARFEQSFALYFLAAAGVLNDPELADLVQPQLADLAAAMRPDGLGYSDVFVSDGDDTAAALVVFAAAGMPANIQLLAPYATGAHYASYAHELQAARSVTARAVHALALAHAEHTGAVDYLLSYQQPNGLWGADKWHSSWTYGTGHVLIALAVAETCPPERIEQAIDGLIVAQHPVGGWGVHGPTQEETAYIMIGLVALRQAGRLSNAGYQALWRACDWLRQDPPYQVATPWIAKSAYQPRRLVAFLADLATYIAKREEVYDA